MPIPARKALGMEFFGREMIDTKAPYFGVNTFEVNEENREEFLLAMGGLPSLPGVSSALMGHRDHGNGRHQYLGIWRYSQDAYPENFSGTPEQIENSAKALDRLYAVVEDFEWYTMSEVDEENPEYALFNAWMSN